MPSTRPRSVAARFALAVLGAGLVGCTSAPPTEAPTVDASAAAICARATTATPAQLSGEPRTVVSEGLVVTWGEGAQQVVWRCGVPRPDALQPTSRCDRINEVGWFSEDLDDGYRFTTIGRAVFVEVYVPHTRAPEGDVLNELTGAVKQIAETKPCV